MSTVRLPDVGGFWWRVRWVTWAVFQGGERTTRARRIRFLHLTGLHGCYVQNQGWLPDDEIIAIQARTIEGLRKQLNQQHRGYQRKVAKLDARLRAVNAANDDLSRALLSAQTIIDDAREDLHQRRVADWYPEGANNAALQMSEDMRLIGNALSEADFSAVLTLADGAREAASTTDASPTSGTNAQ